MKTFFSAAIGTALLATSCAVFAQDTSSDKTGWKVSAELGAISTTGNTQTQSLNGKLDVTQTLKNWENEYTANALYKEDRREQDDGTKKTETTAEKYAVSAKSSYLFDDDVNKVFVFGSYQRDEFGAYLNYTTLAAGYGARIIDRDTLTLDAEIGPGYYWGDKLQKDDTTVAEEGFLVRAAGKLEWHITENATFTQKLGVESSNDNTRYLSDTALSTNISDSMQMKVGYTVSHDTDVAVGKENTDTTTYINLVFNF